MKYYQYSDKSKCNFILLCLFVFSCYSITASSQPALKEICFNFNIVTKQSTPSAEADVYAVQKNLVLHQLTKTQLVFDKNKERKCPEIKLSTGSTKHITWEEARRLSQPIDQGFDESIENYLLRKLSKASVELDRIVNKFNERVDIEYRSLINLRPGRSIVKAENIIEKLISHRKTLNNKNIESSNRLVLNINNAVEKISLKLDSFEKESSADIIRKAKDRINKYEKTDQISASTWFKGELIFWNDIEGQNTSVELKNLLRHYRSPENQCLDLYVIPYGKTPSWHYKEANKNGKWTKRGGAAISTKNFPRTTQGGGHAILLTYNTRESETRLAHELVHLLLSKGDAHSEKKEKDLMHEHSKGGSYLDEIECDQIKENLRTFYGGPSTRI